MDMSSFSEQIESTEHQASHSAPLPLSICIYHYPPLLFHLLEKWWFTLSKGLLFHLSFMPFFICAELPCRIYKYFTMHSLLCGTNFNSQRRTSLKLKLYPAFAFNICPLPVFATVYRNEVIYILFFPLSFLWRLVLINGKVARREEDAKQGRKKCVKENLWNEICKPDKQKLNVNLFENRYTLGWCQN